VSGSSRHRRRHRIEGDGWRVQSAWLSEVLKVEKIWQYPPGTLVVRAFVAGKISLDGEKGGVGVQMDIHLVGRSGCFVLVVGQVRFYRCQGPYAASATAQILRQQSAAAVKISRYRQRVHRNHFQS
jgi:hypothetical protein